MTDRRRALLVAALGFLQLSPQARELVLVHRWRDSWRGVGFIVEGMRRQGYRVSLREIDACVASFSSHPMVSDDGFGSGPTPWKAVQATAWAALKPPTPRFG